MSTEIVKSPMQCMINSIEVKAGDTVDESQVLCIMEAMKMENFLMSPVKGTVTEVKIANGQAVKLGDELFVIQVQPDERIAKSTCF